MKLLKSFSLSLLLLLALFLYPTTASAKVVSSEGPVTINADEVVDDDLFLAGETVTVEGTVNGDLYAAGGEVRVDGIVNGDVLVAGGMIEVSGTIADDLRAAGGNLSISDAQIGDNASLFGGNVNVDANTTVGGSLSFGTGNLVSAAQVMRNVIGGGGIVQINGFVARNIRVAAAELRFGPKAIVEGDVFYSTEEDLKLDKSATIAGQLRRIMPRVRKVSVTASRKFPAVARDLKLGFKFWSYLASLLVGFVVVKLMGNHVEEITKRIKSNTWESLGWGFAIFFLAGPALLMLAITGIGIPLAVILGAFFILELYLAKIFVGIVLGEAVLDLFGKTKASVYALLAVGLAAYYLLSSVRFIGGLVTLATVFFAFGAIFIYKRKLLGKKR